MAHEFGDSYTQHHLDRISYPLGGIGAGGMCLTGTGELEAVSLRHKAAVFNNPLLFASLCLPGVAHGARVIEGPVAPWRPLFPWGKGYGDSSSGLRDTSYGFPRFDRAVFTDRFPAAQVELESDDLPVKVQLLAWSPFIPGSADDSSRPVIVLEYTLVNTSDRELDAVIGLHADSKVIGFKSGKGSRCESHADGASMYQEALKHSWEQGALRIACDAQDVCSDSAWFRGGWFDTSTILWKNIASASHRNASHEGSPGASVTAKLRLPAHGRRRVVYRLSWHVPDSDQARGNTTACCVTDDTDCCEPTTYRPRYAALHEDVHSVDAWLRDHFTSLRERTMQFAELLEAGALPAPLREAVRANLSILRSPTVMRQADGRLWMWEGCFDEGGCCYGSCTHVWNWAQAMAHLFPDLERGLRETEHGPAQLNDGAQHFRVPLPIAQVESSQLAADGQLGGLIKTWRDWRISGNTAWVARLWPRLRESLEHCILTWDPQRTGVMRGAQHNTFDIEFHGPNGMIMSSYLAALRAAADIARAVSDDPHDYAQLADRCLAFLESELWDGRGFIQQIEVRSGLGKELNLNAADSESPELQALLREQGPRNQYGNGLLVTALLGEWMAATGGLRTGLDQAKVRTFLHALLEHNLRRDLRRHVNPQRCGYAYGQEGGLLLCTWPDNEAPDLAFPYCAEVWTGTEYQTASHLMRLGELEPALELVRIVRSRYDGQARNPFDEIECGHWYGRALASYDLLAAWGGARYDAVTRTMHLRPCAVGDYAAPFIRGRDWGLVGVRDGQPFYEPHAGELVIDQWDVCLPGTHTTTPA